MKSLFKTLMIMILVLSMFGCSAKEEEKQTVYKDFTYDNLVFKVDESKDYEEELVSEKWYSLYNSQQKNEISAQRYIKPSDWIDADTFLKTIAAPDEIKEENGLLYAQGSDGTLIRVVENSYYYYILAGRMMSSAERNDDVINEMKDIMMNVEVDPKAIVKMPEDSIFTYKGLSISTPFQERFEEASVNMDFAIVNHDDTMMLMLNATDKSLVDFNDEAMEAFVFDGKDTKDLTNGFRYYEYDASTQNGDVFHYYYSLMYDNDNFYDVTVFTRKADEETYRNQILDILNKIKVD